MTCVFVDASPFFPLPQNVLLESLNDISGQKVGNSSGATVCGAKIYGCPSASLLNSINLPWPLDVGCFSFAALDDTETGAMMWDGMARPRVAKGKPHTDGLEIAMKGSM